VLVVEEVELALLVLVDLLILDSLPHHCAMQDCHHSR
jgi:hypothetical protein